MSNVLNVVVAGATGWTGRAVSEGVLAASDLNLVGATSRTHAGVDLGTAWAVEPLGLSVVAFVDQALDDADVLIDYTAPQAVKANVMAAISSGVHVVVGTSGLSAADYEEIDVAAREHRVGVVASGNFSVTAAMATAVTVLAARFLPQREVIDYASAGKPDAPSGTSRELAERLSSVSTSPLVVPVDETIGWPEARGADIAGTRVHSLRLPSFVVSTEVVFAAEDERLTIRHDAGSTAAPYVAGTLLAVRAVPGIVGVVRGLDTLLLGAAD
ncbi:MAG: 4-hydroxy-tetrahydrodipicolinate reductase [Actinomycetales bacterium]|nr:4-hydroxy-tetrahydrodipicolinate reductase [Actinomycetales bacterium]